MRAFSLAAAFACVGCYLPAEPGTSRGTGGSVTRTTTTTTTSSTTSTTTADAGHCPDPNGSMCPIGAFNDCTPGDDIVDCCQGGAIVHACARAFGILTHACTMYGLTCDSGECAVDLEHEAVACCQSHDPTDPCSL